MKIEELQVTAQLAHLNMDEKELAAAFPAFEQMLGFFAAMQAADKDSAAFPEAAPADGYAAATRTVSSDHFRSDQPHHNPNNSPNTSSTGLNENLLNNAGDRDSRFIVVPNVL
jgi:aspartyl-tRNA(Asn)/glutamyl-tRNA(Gln) amidotransferase subunit C